MPVAPDVTPEDGRWPTDDLWQYAVALYDRAGVAAACLALQDRRGCDVNLILLACWLGMRGLLVRADGAADLVAATTSWQRDVVAPIRAVRRSVKTALHHKTSGPAALLPDAVADWRRKLAEIELEGERLELAALERLAPVVCRSAPAGPELVVRNLDCLVTPDAADRAEITVILRAACPDSRADAIDAALELLSS